MVLSRPNHTPLGHVCPHCTASSTLLLTRFPCDQSSRLSGRNPNPRNSEVPPKYLGGLALDCLGLPRIALFAWPWLDFRAALLTLERVFQRENGLLVGHACRFAACLACPPSFVDRRPWWQREPQGPSIYVQGLVARIHLLDGAGRVGRRQGNFWHHLSDDNGMRAFCLAPLARPSMTMAQTL